MNIGTTTNGKPSYQKGSIYLFSNTDGFGLSWYSGNSLGSLNYTTHYYWTINSSTNGAGITFLHNGALDNPDSKPTTSTDAPLPVELTSFTAASTSSAIVVLNWETATEVNNYGFEVERQILNQVQNDGWETLGFVEGHGNSNSPKYYEFTDENPVTDSAEYRLKQIDIDGRYEYYFQKVQVAGLGITNAKLKNPRDVNYCGDLV